MPKELTEAQQKLREIILTFEEKTSGRIDNKNQIKQFNALVRNEDISDELINFIIDVTDEINTRHFEFVEHTTKTIKEMSEVNHIDIEKLKHLIHKLEKEAKSDKEDTKKDTTPKWWYPSAWSMKDAKFWAFVTLAFLGMMIILFSIGDKETMVALSNIFNAQAAVSK